MALRIAISRLASIDIVSISSGRDGAHFGEPVAQGAFADAEPLGGADAVAADLVERGADDMRLGDARGSRASAGSGWRRRAPARGARR